MDSEGRYERVSSLYENNAGLLSALAILAPDGNVRIAVVNLIDFVSDTDDDALIDRRIILEVIARGIVHGGFILPEEEGYEDLSELNAEEALAHFRKQLEIDDEDEV